METNWIYFTNPFESSTKNNYLKALKISNFHKDALLSKAGDPLFDSLYASYNPIHEAYNTAFDIWNNQKGVQSGKTLGLKQLLKLLANTKISQWDTGIQVVYFHDTAAYKALLPNHHIPFQRGSQLKRVNAVNSFNLALTGIPALAGVKTDVDNFATLLNNAFDLQKMSKTTTTTESNNVEAARIAMCAAMFADYGAMINYFSLTPNNCAPYFDVELIRNSSQVDFTGHLKPGKLHVICKHTFAATDILEIKNDNDTSLNIYLGFTKNAIVPENPLTIEANTHVNITANKLGNLENNYLIISNPDKSLKAKWEVKLV